MAYYCDDEYEVAVLNDETFSSLSFIVDEGALLSSIASESALAPIYETAPILGEGWLIAPGDLFEDAVLNDVLSGSSQYADTETETAVITSEAFPTIGGDLAETAVLNDVVTTTTATVVGEAAVLNDVVTHILTASFTTTEDAVIHGFVLPYYSVLIDEQAVITGDALQTLAVASLTTESAILNDEVFESTATVGDFMEEAVLNDVVFQTAHGYTNPTDPFYGQGYAIVPRAGDAWAAFAPNPAMSRYENLRSAELFVVNGVPLGLSELGISQLTNDGLVPSEVLTGVTDFNNPEQRIDGSKRKHVMVVYADGESVAAYNLRVMTDDNTGAEVERIYAFPYANGAHTRTVRCTLGKRMWARQWQFAFTNSAPHTLREARAQIELTSRRV
jgi:hypothetical protein